MVCVAWCVCVCVVCCVGVGVGVWWWCCVVWFGVYFCLFVLFFSFSLNFIYSFLSSSPLSSLLSIFSLSLPLFSLLFLFSSLSSSRHHTLMVRTDQPTRWRRASAQQSVLSLLLSPPSSLLSLPSSKKREGTFYYRNISGKEFIFYYSFKLIPKNRRRVKLQSLQF